MIWVLLDVAIGVLAVLLVAAMAFLIFRRVRVLMSAIGSASDRVGEMTPRLALQPPPRDVG